MPKDVVFVLHGIGKYDEQWMADRSGAAPALQEAATGYSHFQTSSLDRSVEFVPILYDDVFQRIMTTWSDMASGLRASLPVMPKVVDETLTFLEGLDEDDWEKTHAADVLLYWGFRLFQQRVSLRVLHQIVGKIVATSVPGEPPPGYHILAHSLGTAVAADALHHLGTESWLTGLTARHLGDKDEDAREEQQALAELIAQMEMNFGTSNPFHPTLFTFESITMLSNVSGL
ncbi:MAG: hypothetical protein AAFX85_13905, partial [Pseudomonadota bacterium]